MKETAYLKTNHRQVEILVLFIYSIYNVSVFIIGNEKEWNQWGLLFVMSSMLFAWFFFFIQYKTYTFRAYYTSTVCQISMLFYAYSSDSLFNILSIFTAVVILFGLYGIPKLIAIPAFS
ncbi:MAG: hypothetical protein IKJ01_08210, partial [Lachnospiraceae bacterium]|nr:hypothetical protein [Lachnospiraceae bacterium]